MPANRTTLRRPGLLLALVLLFVGLWPRESAARQEPAPAEIAAQASQPQQAGAKDKDSHTSFLRWVHLDGLWIPGQTDAGMLGLVGMHIAVARVGRMNFFGPPGVMLVRQDTQHGRIFRPGFTWGFGYQLTDVHVPGVSRPMTLFLNVTKCWTTGNENTGMSMVGLSLTWVR